MFSTSPMRLLGRHVAGRAHDGAGQRVGSPTEPGALRTVATIVSWDLDARAARPRRRRGSSTFARPQSMTCTSPNAPTMTFAGFRSRWITPAAWAYAIVWQTGSKIARSRAAVVPGLACGEQRREGVALDELHGEERPALVGGRARRRGRCPGAGAGRRSAPPRRSAAATSGWSAYSSRSTFSATSRPRSRVVPLEDDAHAAARDLALELVLPRLAVPVEGLEQRHGVVLAQGDPGLASGALFEELEDRALRLGRAALVRHGRHCAGVVPGVPSLSVPAYPRFVRRRSHRTAPWRRGTRPFARGRDRGSHAVGSGARANHRPRSEIPTGS